MTDKMDVLVMESRRHYADVAVATLEGAGHRVQRCHDPEVSGFPCRGVTSPADCPIDRGVDVALVVRPRVAPQPTPLETGVSCALHAGVPLVEKGTAACDPFEPWLARRVGDEGVVEACEEAMQTAWASLRERIERRGMDVVAGTAWAGPIGCSFERHDDHLRVRLSGPPLDKEGVHALSIRVLDAVRADGRRYAGIDISYVPVPPTRVS